jgi:hypothetical protein
MYTYGIGGNEVKLDGSEAIADIPANRTLLVQQLTEEEPPTPEPVYGLKTVGEVFDKFQPKVGVEFETAEGESRPEELQFHNLGDFDANKMIEQSEFLSGLGLRQDQYSAMVRQLSSNKVLQKALSDETTRNAVIQALDQALQELESAK